MYYIVKIWWCFTWIAYSFIVLSGLPFLTDCSRHSYKVPNLLTFWIYCSNEATSDFFFFLAFKDVTERRTEEARGFVELQGVMTAGLNQEAKETVCSSVFLFFFFFFLLLFFRSGHDSNDYVWFVFLYDLYLFIFLFLLLTFVLLCNGGGRDLSNSNAKYYLGWNIRMKVVIYYYFTHHNHNCMFFMMMIRLMMVMYV